LCLVREAHPVENPAHQVIGLGIVGANLESPFHRSPGAREVTQLIK
jgi:hypothetical protein